MSNTRIEIPEKLFEALSKDAVTKFGLQSVTSIALKRVIQNPYSQVFVVEICQARFCHKVYVKIPHSEFHGFSIQKERLLAEYAIMQELSSGIGNDRDYGVAIPFGCYQEYPAIATFEAAKKTLRMHYRTRARLVSLPFLQTTLIQEVENCGLWLREFQEKTYKEDALFDTEELEIYCEVRLERLLKNTDLDFSNKLAEEIKKTICELGKEIQPGENRTVGRHNDFASHNILANKGKIWVIDFSMFDYGPSDYDPCNFWLDLEMLKPDPTYSKSFLSMLQSRFLTSYGLTTPETPAFNLARCRYTLNRLVTSLEGSHGWGPGSFYRRDVVRECMKWLEYFAARPSLS